MSLFYFFGGDGTDLAGLGGGCIPRRWRPQPPAHPDRLRHTAGSTADRARTRADHTRHDTHARTLGTKNRSAPDTRQAARGRSYRRRVLGCGECPKLCRFGHSAAVQKYISFLNTFVACATKNPFTVSQKCDIIMSQE